MSETLYTPGSLVKVRNRDWVVLPSEDPELLKLKPLGGSEEEITAIYTPLRFPEDEVKKFNFPDPGPADLADFSSAKLLYNATRLSFRNGAGPFRSFGRLSFRPRSYQLVPLMMALRQPVVRLMIADDVGIGKTIEAGIIARELMDRGELRSFAVLCLPHLCEQWKEELKEKFGIEAVIIRSGSITALEKQLRGDTSIYRHFPYQVISIDYAKSDHHRMQFVSECPKFVIVDEAHTCANTSGKANSLQQQRYRLLRELAAKADQNMLLLTATPHSGKQDEFQSLLGLLNPKFATASFDVNEKENIKEVAAHFIQRRRVDIKKYLNEKTDFAERVSREVEYSLGPEYLSFFSKVIKFARGLVKDSDTTGVRQRMRYFAALALLRGVMSSPAAGAEMLRNKAIKLDGSIEQELSESEENPVLDNDYGKDRDVLPVEVVDHAELTKDEAKALSALSKELEKLGKPSFDKKASAALDVAREWLKAGLHPVIFCRYIETANYLGSLLKKELAGEFKGIEVETITGEMHDEQRKERIEALGRSGKRRLVVCTDCLSEGINLQQHFNALLHYDLPWNPNRLEQREGRIDRYGQCAPEVYTYLLYGTNNPIDAVVLQVLLRKARQIREAIGISVPFPEDSKSITEAVLNAVLLNPDLKPGDGMQLGFDFGEDETIQESKIKVQDAYEREKVRCEHIRNQFAQNAIIKTLDIEDDLKQSDAILGNPEAVKHFVIQAVRYLDGQIIESGTGYKLYVDKLIPQLQHIFGNVPEALISFDSPTPQGYRYIGRNHPFVEQLCSYILACAFEHKGKHKVARASVFHTSAVSIKTVIVQFRVRNVIARRNNAGELVAEELLLWGYRQEAKERNFLDAEEAAQLLETIKVKEDVNRQQQPGFLQKEVEHLGTIKHITDSIAKERCSLLVKSHEKFRKALGNEQYKVGTVLPMDVLGIYILFPKFDI